MFRQCRTASSLWRRLYTLTGIFAEEGFRIFETFRSHFNKKPNFGHSVCWNNGRTVQSIKKKILYFFKFVPFYVGNYFLLSSFLNSKLSSSKNLTSREVEDISTVSTSLSKTLKASIFLTSSFS